MYMEDGNPILAIGAVAGILPCTGFVTSLDRYGFFVKHNHRLLASIAETKTVIAAYERLVQSGDTVTLAALRRAIEACHFKPNIRNRCKFRAHFMCRNE